MPLAGIVLAADPRPRQGRRSVRGTARTVRHRGASPLRCRSRCTDRDDPARTPAPRARELHTESPSSRPSLRVSRAARKRSTGAQTLHHGDTEDTGENLYVLTSVSPVSPGVESFKAPCLVDDPPAGALGFRRCKWGACWSW